MSDFRLVPEEDAESIGGSLKHANCSSISILLYIPEC